MIRGLRFIDQLTTASPSTVTTFQIKRRKKEKETIKGIPLVLAEEGR
jgi:hypothetical protein